MRKSFGALRNQPKMMFNPAMGGFTVIYPHCDREMLAKLREYQGEIRSTSPGWTSRLDYKGGRCELQVFPLSNLPGVMFSSPDRYGRRHANG